MAGATSSVKGVLADFLTPIITKIFGEPTRGGLIKIHQTISLNAASFKDNLIRGRHGHLALTMDAEDYLEQTGHMFAPPYNPGDYPPTMGTEQEQTLWTNIFCQNQALFR